MSAGSVIVVMLDVLFVITVDAKMVEDAGGNRSTEKPVTQTAKGQQAAAASTSRRAPGLTRALRWIRRLVGMSLSAGSVSTLLSVLCSGDDGCPAEYTRCWVQVNRRAQPIGLHMAHWVLGIFVVCVNSLAGRALYAKLSQFSSHN